jgi:methylmalonyl-CoA mutase N-terminal domain/subunit
MEALTQEIEERAVEYIDKIDEMGGAIKAIESGFVQREIANSAYKYQRDIEDKERIIVGLNEFTAEEAPFTDILKISPEVERYQKQKLDKVRGQQDSKKFRNSLEGLKEAAQGTENLMPYIIEAVKSYVTLGEIADALREVFGEYKEHTIIT